MSYVDSTKIRIFPLGQTRLQTTGFQDDRYLSERNLTQMLSRFVDEDSYVLRFNKNTATGETDNSSLEFVLKGYYVNWLKVDTDLKSNNPEYVYANVVLENEVMQGDNETTSKFEGVNIEYRDNLDTALSDLGYLLLLDKNDDGVTWDIPAASKFKHSGESLFITNTAKTKVSVQSHIDMLTTQVDDAITDANAATDAANNAAANANNATTSANEAADAANASKDEANAAKDAANTAKDEANNAAVSANEAAAAANASKDEANNAAVSANAAKDAANNAVSSQFGADPENSVGGLTKEYLDAEVATFKQLLTWKQYPTT